MTNEFVVEKAALTRPGHIAVTLNPAQGDEDDVVLGHRYLPEGTYKKIPLTIDIQTFSIEVGST